MMTRLHRLTIVLCFVAVGAVAVLQGNHSWGNYHWARTANPFALDLGDNLTTDWDPYLATASNDWSVSEVLDTSVAAGGTSAKRCKPTAGQVEVCNSKYGRNGWLGIAQIWASGDHITQGVVKLNDTYFVTSTYNSPAWKNLVMCQEVGHTFGLDHQDENFGNPPLGTCMDYSNDPVPNQHPNAHDYEQLASIYAHTDGTTTIGAGIGTGPGQSGRTEYDSPSDWGRLMKTTRGGRAATFELDLGGGRRLITFVIWA